MNNNESKEIMQFTPPYFCSNTIKNYINNESSHVKRRSCGTVPPFGMACFDCWGCGRMCTWRKQTNRTYPDMQLSEIRDIVKRVIKPVYRCKPQTFKRMYQQGLRNLMYYHSSVSASLHPDYCTSCWNKEVIIYKAMDWFDECKKIKIAEDMQNQKDDELGRERKQLIAYNNNVFKIGSCRTDLAKELKLRNSDPHTDSEDIIKLLNHFTTKSSYDTAVLYGPDFCQVLSQICYNHHFKRYIFNNVNWSNVN
jgi:hypothetical protein